MLNGVDAPDNPASTLGITAKLARAQAEDGSVTDDKGEPCGGVAATPQVVNNLAPADSIVLMDAAGDGNDSDADAGPRGGVCQRCCICILIGDARGVQLEEKSSPRSLASALAFSLSSIPANLDGVDVI